MEELTLEGLRSLRRSCHVAELLAGWVAAGRWRQITFRVLVSKVVQRGQERSARWLPHTDLLGWLTHPPLLTPLSALSTELELPWCPH